MLARVSRTPKKITRLSDDFGQYEIQLRCARCKHLRTVQPGALARILGWNAELTAIARRMRCSSCDAKQCELTVRGMMRRRDYRPAR